MGESDIITDWGLSYGTDLAVLYLLSRPPVVRRGTEGSAGSDALSRHDRVPLAPDVVSGLINLRGQIVTAVDRAAASSCRPPT